MPRLNSSTQATKIAPMMTVTSEPTLSANSFSNTTMTPAPTTGPSTVPIPPTSVISTTSPDIGGLGTIFGPIVGSFAILAMQYKLAWMGQWVLVIQGVIFVVCVLLFRRGIVGEIAHRLRIKL